MSSNEESSIRLHVESYPLELGVKVVGSLGGGEHKTHSVHQAGIFIITDDPAPPKQLLRLMIYMSDQAAVEVWGSVDRVVNSSDASPGQPAGMGIQFFSMDAKSELVWNELIEGISGKPVDTKEQFSVSSSHRTGPRRTPAPLSGNTPLPLPSVPTGETSVQVRPRDIRALVRLVNRDLAAGRLKLQSSESLLPGTPLTIIIRHPTTGARVSIPGQAEARMDNGMLSVRVLGLGQEDWRTLQRFAVTGISRSRVH